MDKHIIKMPDIGEGIAEVEIVEWHVAVGDQVSEDQVLADVMTDKASVEIPSPVAGTVLSLGGEVGEIKAVGSELVVINTGVTTEDVAQTPDTRASLDQREPAEQPMETGSSPVQTVDTREGMPSADAAARVETRADRSATSVRSAPDVGTDVAEETIAKVLASPSVRHRARQLDIDLRELAVASGETPISHRDLDQFLLARFASSGNGQQGAIRGAVAREAAGAGGQNTAIGAGVADDKSDTRIKVVGLRRQIAQKMQESKREIPHFTYVEEIDVTDLEQLRQTLNSDLPEGGQRLTLLPFIVRAMVLAVQRHPAVNAHFDSGAGELIRYGAVHMGIATQTDNGLVVPVLHDAHTLDVHDCAAEIARLTSRTRSGRAQRSELTGSTITLSSLGPLGGLVATPIINHPEVAIVGVNRIIERPVLVHGQFVVRKLMNLSSSFDHRVIDGMDAALFIQEVRRYLEAPGLLLAPRPG